MFYTVLKLSFVLQNNASPGTTAARSTDQRKLTKVNELPKGIKFPQNLSVKVLPTTKPTGGNLSVQTVTARGQSYQKTFVSGLLTCFAQFLPFILNCH